MIAAVRGLYKKKTNRFQKPKYDITVGHYTVDSTRQ